MILLLALFLLSTAFALLGRRRSCFLAAAFAFAWLELLGSGLAVRLLPSPIAEAPLASPAFGPRNAIVLLGGGVTRWPSGERRTSFFAIPRVSEAARLYQLCRKDPKRACRVLASGGNEALFGRAEADVMAEELAALGVAPGDITREAKSANTFRNAELSAPLLMADEKVFLVSSGFHLRRAQLYFAHFGVRGEPAPADYIAPRSSLWPQAYNALLFELSLHEALGVLRYHWYQRMGWNPVQPSKPGVL